MEKKISTMRGILAALITVGALAGGAIAQSTIPAGRISLVQDWSHSRVRYSNTGTLQQRVDLMKEPRALHQWLERAWRPNFQAKPGGMSQGMMSRIDGDSEVDGTVLQRPFNPARPIQNPTRIKNKNSEVDWAVSLGSGGQFPTGETPAKYQFDVTKPPDCANDFAVFPINATPGANQANLIAINNLYAGTNPTGLCGTAPTVMWAYKLGSAGTALSPALSLDGKKVAFIETGTRAILHVLTWTAGEGTSAIAPFSGTPNDVTLDCTTAAGTGCTNTAAGDSNASPYVDYTADGVFVAANNGILYHVKNLFGGTPTMDFCTVVSANAALTSPVYDSNVGKVFISDGASVYSVDFNPNSGFSNSKSITVANAGGIILSPIIDGSSQMVYVFSGSKNGATNSIVSQIPYSLASHAEASIGTQATGYVLDGMFDNNFYTSSDPTTWTLYACGRTATATAPALYGLTFAANGVMNTTPLFGPNTNINPGNGAGSCSPLQEFYNGSVDRLFASTTGSNTVSMFNITNRLNATSVAVATASGYSGGTGNFAVDNISAAPQASSIYFGTMATSTTTCPTVAPPPTLAVQTHGAGSSATNGRTLTVTLPATAPVGSLIVVGVGGNSTARTITRILDNGSGGSNTYTQVAGARQTGTGVFADMWVALKTTRTANAITITYSGNLTRRDAEVWAVSGFSNAAIDVVAGNSGAAVGGTLTGASVTTTAADDFVAAFVKTSGTITANPKAGNEFTAGGDITGNGSAGASLITTSAGAHQPAWTGSGNFASATVAFKENAAAPTANYCAVKLTQSALQ